MSDLRSCPTCQASFPAEFAACPRDGTLLESGADLLVGTTLRDTYRITHVLGAGGLGRVYHATHLRMPRSYAVKVPRGMWVDHPKARARFLNEAQAAGRLTHPHIASVLDVGETANGLPYLMMEFAPGAPLTDGVALPLPARAALQLLRQVAVALAHAHAHGVVHRDLKPDNILVHAGHVRIVDFGIALVADLGQEGRLTTKGSAIGTPHYMAPEQLLGGTIDHRADLYALGAILYEILAGCRPYEGSLVDYVHHVVAGKLPTFAVRAPGLDIDPRVEELCRWLMARAADDRPPDADAVVAAIDELLAVLPQQGPTGGASLVPWPARIASGSGAPSSVRWVETQPTLHAPVATEGEVTDRVRVRARWWNPFTWGRKRA